MVESPKKRFLRQKKIANAVGDAVTSTEFQVAADAAMLQMFNDMPETVDPQTAVAIYHRMYGAKQYLGHLQTLADQPKPPAKRRSSDNLQHIT